MKSIKPLLYGQERGTVRLELPPIVVEIDALNTPTLLAVVLTAIRETGDHETIEAARMTCRLMLGAR